MFLTFNHQQTYVIVFSVPQRANIKNSSCIRKKFCPSETGIPSQTRNSEIVPGENLKGYPL